MTCTVRGYPSLQNYKDEVEKNPDALRPDCCPVSFIALMAPPNYRLKEPLFRCQKLKTTQNFKTTELML